MRQFCAEVYMILTTLELWIYYVQEFNQLFSLRRQSNNNLSSKSCFGSECAAEELLADRSVIDVFVREREEGGGGMD